MTETSAKPLKLLIKHHRNPKAGHHHGGAWKIAYADFVTAMMAFFLLLWLLGMVNVSKLKGVAEYFRTPLLDSPPPVRQKQAEIPPLVPPAQLLRQRVQQVIAANPALVALGPQVLLDVSDDGLRIQLLDTQDRPMFERGSARLQPYAKTLLQSLAVVLNDTARPVVISGHTDATPYAGGERGYSNWELSSDRAHAARRELVAGHLRESAVAKVEGLGAAQLWVSSDPFDPRNRRISLWVQLPAPR